MTNDVQVINISTLADISDAIKEQEGSTEGIPVPDFGKRIRAIPKAKPEQTKTVEITSNGATEIFPDEGYTLSKVVANVSVGGGENKLAQLAEGTLTEITAEDLEGATKIGEDAFYGNIIITSVTIPHCVTSIGTQAFYQCKKLTSITIPDSVTSIGSRAFAYCSKLASITIPDSVMNMTDRVFDSCTSLGSVTLGKGVAKLSNYMFAGCKKLTSVTIPNGVTEIDYYLFSNCTGLTSITIPNSIIKMGYYLFSNCTGLTNVKIGNGITTIDTKAFHGCTALTDIYIDAPEDSISGAPWGAPNSPTIHWNTPLPSEE